MFSIAAINDTDTKGQWEPLAPSKEAQEFHLSQTYHEGLHKLHSNEYEKACELFESILKDPLITSAQEENSSSDGHLLHLRFLALKNLASVFLQQGSAYFERALHCYLQAVEIDAKDSVVWNQLGTLSCSMGLLSISRWAFEQGLLCSPNNWIFMEKLLEVLIAIGDEVACLAVAEMILRHWPSHSRALCVKSTIEESEIVPFAPRGIDKLEPKHARLKFSEKRKSPDENLDAHRHPKKSKPNIEIKLAEASWNALADALLGILLPLSGCESNGEEKELRSGDVCLNIQLPSSPKDPLETKAQNLVASGDDESQLDLNGEKGGSSKEKAVNILKEQPQERRSTRLERMRSHKPEKEESEFAASKDNAEVIKFLEPFVTDLLRNEESSTAASCSAISCEETNSCEMECGEVEKFVRENSGNFGAYHLVHLLLEEAANSRLRNQDVFGKFLGLEKLCRNWGQDRTPGCSLFLAELYYDLGLSSEAPELTDFMTDSSYHLCKIVESVALEESFSSSSGNGRIPFLHNFQGFCDLSGESSGRRSPTLRNLLLNSDECFFWVRFFWLSGRLAFLDDKKNNAYQQFCMALSILSKEDDSSHYLSVSLPHCKTIRELTVDRLLYEINMLKFDVSLEKEVQEMYDKQMYLECINLLAPLLFCTKDTYLDVVASRRRIKGIASRELFALETLIKACEKTKPVLIDVCLTCHQRKLQNLLAAAGIDEFPSSCKIFPQKPESTEGFISDADSGENASDHWSCLVAEEVKAISHCALLVKNSTDTADSNDLNIQTSSIHDVQLLLLTVMCNIARILSSKKSVAMESIDLTEQKQRSCFTDAAIAFCKFQFLDLSMPIKSQVQLIVAIHDLLAEYGLCCAGEGKIGEEGTFLRFAIKHLLALDMKLKSTYSLNGEGTQANRQLKKDSNNDSDSAMSLLKTIQTGDDEATSIEKDTAEGLNSNSDLLQNFSLRDNVGAEHKKADAEHHDDKVEGDHKLASVFTGQVTEDEKEELEMKIDSALDQCFFCLYGLNLRSDSSYEDELAMHKNTSRGEYQTKEQSADVFQYLLPYAKGSSKTGLVKLRRVLRAIRKHFQQPPESVLAGNPIDKFLDDHNLCEDELSEDSGLEGFFQTMIKTIFSSFGGLKQYKKSLVASSEQYVDVYCNLYFFLAQSEEMSATDKWPGFVLTKEGEEFVQQNANLFKYDLLYNPLRFESWQRLGNIYDEEVDLLLNDGSKHINVLGWRKNATLSQRVETSRRRSRRCLLMSLALANTPAQQCEIHELLALVYYDSLQNVAPLYDQRSILPAKDAAWITFCENSMKHFKKAFANKPDWSHAYYMGKLSEKLGCAHETYLSYYDKAIALNPSAVDPVYRMHASRLKLLCKFGPQNMEAIKVVSAYSFSQSTKAAAIDSLNKIGPEVSCSPMDSKEVSQTKAGEKTEESYYLEDVWNMLYNDCLAALETCIEGDLKHFHKARYMLAQGFYRRGRSGDLERAKEELSFCFRSSRSSFTINMWEIDGMVKKGRRRTPNVAANKKALEVILPESSRKFITCIRKYILFYLKLLEEAKDVSTLDKAFISIKADKRFSLCVEDLVPVALARYIRALIASSSPDYPLEKLFSLFMEQGNIWPDVCSLPETKGPETSDSSLYGYLHQYIHILEKSSKLETIEAINEKLRKRFKNPKLSNSNCAKVCRHASVAWCRSLIISLAAITPLELGQSTEIQDLNLSDERSESSPLLCIDLQTNELWNSQFEDATQLKAIEMKWSPILSKIKNTVIKKVFDHHLDTANSLLRCSYNFYRDSSCVTLPNAVNLYLVSHRRLATESALQTATQGIEVLDLSVPRKLLLWAYTLLHGHCPSISAAVKYCEENVKEVPSGREVSLQNVQFPKTKKGTVAAPTSTSTPSTMATTQTGGGKDSAVHSAGREGDSAPTSIVLALPESGSLSREWQDRSRSSHAQVICSESNKNLFSALQLQHCNNSVAEKSTSATHDQGLDDVNVK